MKRFLLAVVVAASFIVVIIVTIALMTPEPQGRIQGPAKAPKKELVYNPGTLPPQDSALKVKVGDPVPEFTLTALDGKKVSPADYKGKKNVVISFVPAAWTPVCSDQWPGYNVAREMFEERDAVMLGITVDNAPSLYAWTENMGGVWFPVLSDFSPHGETAKKFGILRSDGTSERALFVIDREGIIRYIDVHDINERPPLDKLLEALDKLKE